jgi:DNA polymerase/3'-5' exonuclease PolX
VSVTETRRPLAAAIEDAEAFRALFPAACYERWEVAWSVRRRSAFVGDVEHLVIPAFGDVDRGEGLFALPERVNLLWFHLDALHRKGDVEKHWYGSGHRWGEQQRGVDWRGFRHEIYTADADNWGSNLAIRTGPADLSVRLVSSIKQFGHDHAGGFRVVHVATGRAVPTPDERQYFRLCGVPWAEPAERR